MENIDIVIKGVDNEDPAWYADYLKYKDLEIKSGAQAADNAQAFGAERIRNGHIIKYWFRSIQKNCPWARKIFLVVQRESQVPAGINRECPKLTVVTHDKFIPSELLPTFNTWTIEMFTHRIPDLSEKFISFDDDFFVLNKITPDIFFEGDKPIIRGKQIDAYKQRPGVFWKVMHNTVDFEKLKYPNLNHTYTLNHLPVPRRKSLEKQIVQKYYSEVMKRFTCSKFRHPNNINHLVFQHLELLDGTAVLKPDYTDSKQITLSNDVDYDKLKTYKMVCFNDSEKVTDFKNIKNKLIYFLNYQMEYWHVCSFEKYSYETVQDKKQENPKFTFLIPVYNAEKFVERCINSVPRRPDSQIIVIDDGSTDSSLAKLKQFKDITILKNKCNSGVAVTRNFLLKEATGEYIFFLDSDDFLYTDIVNKVMDKLSSNVDVYKTQKERNDKKIYWSRVWIGCFVKRSLFEGATLPDMIIDEDKYLVDYAYKKKSNLNLVLGKEVFYHYNIPNVGSLAWNYYNHLNDGRAVSKIKYEDKVYKNKNPQTRSINIQNFLKMAEEKATQKSKTKAVKVDLNRNIDDGLDSLDNGM